MSDTPETDSFMRGLAHETKTAYTLESFARRLERERDEARQEATDYRNADAETHGVEPTPLPWEQR